MISTVSKKRTKSVVTRRVFRSQMVKNALAAEIRGDYSAPKTPRWIEVGKSKRREGKETGEEVKGREKKGEKG